MPGAVGAEREVRPDQLAQLPKHAVVPSQRDGVLCNIYNLIPGVVYHYEILNEQNTVLKSGFVRPTGQIRMINGFSYNVRDMGGWQASGGTIAYGKLYRGAQLNGISNAGKTIFLNDMGILID